MEEILNTMDVQFIVLGSGESKYENSFRYFQGKYPDKLCAHIGYSEQRSHKVYASCDAFLMPSLFEPCGLSQMMSMRYGTLPIVRETGGLKDTVEPYNEYENTGTGFSFANYNAHEMMDTIRYAYNTYRHNSKAWGDMVGRAMDKNFSWNSSAREYEAMYDKICDIQE
jgi:starch synthase